MGLRERQAHRQQQKQQSLGQSYQSEQRVTLPAPSGMNRRDDMGSLSNNEAIYVDNAFPDQAGLRIGRAPITKVICPSATAGVNMDLISYSASSSTEEELWALHGRRIYNIGEVIDSSATATASFVSTPVASLESTFGDYTQISKTIIYVQGVQTSPIKYTKASGWEAWSATISGGDIRNPNGITKFKNRVFLWNDGSTAFHYSSVDQFLATFETFDLGPLIGDNIKICTSLTRDGGAGPDDYAIFIAKNGKTAVYAGTDPGVAANWSLVGVYQIGKPCSRNSFAQYGNKLFVLCEDDVWILPDDFVGKDKSTKMIGERAVRTGGGSPEPTTGLHWQKKGLIVFSDATVLDPKRGYSFVKARLNKIASQVLPPPEGWRFEQGVNVGRQRLAEYRENIYTVYDGSAGDQGKFIVQVLPDKESKHVARIHSKPIQLSGRTNISMVNPVFKTRVSANGAVTGGNHIKYRTAILYDQEHKDMASATVSAALWLTTSTSTDSQDLWTPGFGTGRAAQIIVEMLSASTSAEIVLRRIDVTLSDTGGL